MKISGLRVTDLRFSQAPLTLKKNLCTPTSPFGAGPFAGGSWFGPVALSLVEVETDEGLAGVGTIGGFTAAGGGIVRDYLAPVVLGHSPFDTEALWDRMYRSTVRFGGEGVAMAAISAVDIALWDIKGKALGQPVYNLLGGRVRDKLPVYASRLYALEDLDELAEEARGFVREGYLFLKQRFGFGPADGREGLRRNVELVKTVREAVGDSIEIAADAYMGWDFEYAFEMERRLRPYGLAWIEEPFLPHDLSSYVRLRRDARTPISCGEHRFGKQGFLDLISSGAVDILQPDANRAGGITETKKICALAEAHGLRVCPHSNEAHNLHVIFSQANCPLVEYFPPVEPDTGNELFWKVFTGEPRAENGYIRPSERPGLGIEIHRETVEALRWNAA